MFSHSLVCVVSMNLTGSVGSLSCPRGRIMCLYVYLCLDRNIAMAIIHSSQWKKALRHTNIVQGEVTSPLRRLIKRMPGKVSPYHHSIVW